MAITSANAVINLLPQADMMPKAPEPQKKTEGRSSVISIITIIVNDSQRV